MKKIIDENGRLFGLISLIDVAVIALVGVLALALYAKDTAMPIGGISDPMQPIRYQVLATHIPQERLDSIKVGDQIYDNETGKPMGEIKEIQTEDCVVSLLKNDGTFVMAPIEDRYNVTLTVDAKVMVDERGHYYVNRTNLIGVGWSMNFSTKACFFGGTILEME